MHNIKPDPAERNRFSNFVYQSEDKLRNGLKSISYIESLCKQSGLGLSSNINICSNKKFDVLRECCSSTSKNESIRNTPVSQRYFLDRFREGSLIKKQIEGSQNFKEKMLKNHCEGDTETKYEPLLTQEDLASLPFDRTFNVVNFLKQNVKQELKCDDYNQNILYEKKINCKNLLTGSALTKAYLQKNLSKLKRSATEVKANLLPQTFKPCPKNIIRSHSYVENLSFLDEPINHNNNKNHDDDDQVPTKQKSSFDESGGLHLPLSIPLNLNEKTDKKTKPNLKVSEITQTELKTKSFSFMSPTIASECKNQSLEIKSIEKLIISPNRKKRSISPKPVKRASPKPSFSKKSNICVLDQEKFDVELKIDEKDSVRELESRDTSSTTREYALFQAVAKLRDLDWNMALRGLAEVVEICKILEPDLVLPHMTLINQRLIDLIKSPRSHVSRSSCQALGHIFEYVKDTRRPEFDELVDSLLCKCADSNKFIRHDANLALDCMVTHIPTFHAVRAICAKGPEHKNHLVRTAAARILVCAVVLTGPENILLPQSNEYTRRRIIIKMAGFLEDRNSDVRKYGERIYKMLSKDKIFDQYLNRYLEKDVINKMRKIMKDSNVV